MAQTTPQSVPDPNPLANGEWVVGAADVAQLLQTQSVTVLDTRPSRAFVAGHVKGAVRVDWTQFSQQADPNRGKLLPRNELQAALRAVGIRADRPVVVVGDPPNDWGEDGRVLWMLRFAGHQRAALVDGGISALRRHGIGNSKGKSRPSSGDFVVTWDTDLSAVRDDLLRGGAVVIDTRAAREYRGATPYGESRGGHVPGARSLPFRELMAADGTLKSVEEIRARMAELGASRNSPIITYCTGGVRSGWLVAALRHAGFSHARNYAGSMWDWAAAPAAQYPLQAP